MTSAFGTFGPVSNESAGEITVTTYIGLCFWLGAGSENLPIGHQTQRLAIPLPDASGLKAKICHTLEVKVHEAYPTFRNIIVVDETTHKSIALVRVETSDGYILYSEDQALWGHVVRLEYDIAP